MASGNKKITSFPKRMALLCLAILFFSQNFLLAQVISNSGVAISVSSGAVVISKDIENTSGSLGNNGIINLDGYFLNYGAASGNGFFNLKGDWTNYGTFSAGTSTVSLLGTSNQTIFNNSSGETFYNLTINNPGTITQLANPGSTLGINNDLTLALGSLSLDQSTSVLSIGGKASIAGTLRFNSITTQTTSIVNILSGAGTIDMSGGSLPHILNLAGATNAIGTFSTSASGSSTVNYNGTNQTVFAAGNYRNLIISNSGIKTLQGNSVIGINLNIKGGTFDLGTTATTVGVSGNTIIAGSLSFNGTTTKTVSLTGDLSGAGEINMTGGNLPHLLNLAGQLNSIGSYYSGSGSIVNYLLNGDQTVFTSNNYRNLQVTGTGVKSLYGDISASGILTMSAGNINSNGNTIKITNSAIDAIARSAGSIIGKLQRAIGITGSEYLYPTGTASVYNPLKITFSNLAGGPLTAQFIQEYIGNAGLPLDDDGNEIFDTYTTGYWSLSSVAPMASGSFSVKLTYDGFLGVDLSSGIVKRTNGGNLELDGENGTLSGTEITRTNLKNGISSGTTDLAIGRGRPRISKQPDNTDICEGANAFFKVTARGRGTLSYHWQVNTGSGSFTDIPLGGVYGTSPLSDRLELTAAPYFMNGYLYRCVITDGQGNSNISNVVLLTVNKIPVATTTPSVQNECPGVGFIDIVLGTINNVTGTTYGWTRTNPAGIITNLPLSGSADGDKISGVFSNTTNSPIIVTFTIIPTGPATTFCVGNPVSASVTVNPTPRVYTLPAAIIQCDSTNTSIQLVSPSTFTGGFVSFKYSVTSTGSVTGYTTTSGLPNNHYITDKLVNQTDNYQTVTYRVVPVSPAGCADGPSQTVAVTVNPTPRAVPLNIKPEICFGGKTEIVLRSPSVMTSGSIVFDYTVSVTGGPGIVAGNTSGELNHVPGYIINRQYNNSSDTLQSVYFAIRPKVDNNICLPGKTFVSEVKVHPVPLQSLIIPKTLTCEGGSDAALRAILARGTAPFNVAWDGPFEYHSGYTTSDHSTDVVNLIGGYYTVSVTDNLGCQNSSNKFISGAKLDENFYAIQKVNGFGTTCPEPASKDGELWIRESSESTGIAPFEYWIVYNNRDTVIHNTFNTINVFHKYDSLPSGSYKLFIKDSNGCYNTDSQDASIVAPDMIKVEFSKKVYRGDNNVSCKNEDDGSVEVKSVTGGSGSYLYKWSSATGLPLGVTTNTSLLDSVPAGKYYLMTTDISGCIKMDSVILTEPLGMELAGSALSFSPDGNSNISCKGGNDGFIKLNLTGGTGKYNYSWASPTNGFTGNTKDIFNLKAGTYVGTFTDENNCVLRLMPGSVLPSFTLTEPAPLEISGTTSTSKDGSFSINCYGGKGSVNISVTGGGAGDYKYSWSTINGSGIVSGSKDQNALTSGTYTLLVTDSNNCTASKEITLTQPPSFGLQLSPTNITCLSTEFNNGSINLTVSGGVAPYNYLWSNGSVNEDIAGLTEGYYRVTVTYNNTCSKTDSVRVEMPAPLSFTKKVSDYNGYNISCSGLANGSVSVTPLSGLAPFSYKWTTPDGRLLTANDLAGLKAGKYTLLITDSNFCKSAETIDLTEPGRLGMSLTLSESTSGGFNINCAGESTGSIGIEPLNQVKSVNYLWEDGIFGSSRRNLPAGNYSVIITDGNNCHASSVITLKDPESLKLAFDITQPICPDKPDGEIRLNVSGGVPGASYSYKWSDNSTGRNISNILRGLYKVTVMDNNGCFIKDSVMIKPLNETCLVIPNAISPNNDLINDVWNIDKIELYPLMEVKLFNRWGEIIWRSQKGYPQPWDGKINGVSLPIDSYHYIIDLHNGTKPIIGNVTIVR